MISREDVFQIGQIQRPHGLQGEIAFSFTSEIFDEINIPYFVCEIDGILVPFFIEDYRYKNDDIALVKFEGIDNDGDAKFLSNAPIFIEKKFLPHDVTGDEIEGVVYYIGFKITDSEGNLIGVVKNIDDETENILFLLENEVGKEFIIPICDEYVIKIDDDNKTIQMDLPDGLLTMNDED